MADFNYVPYKNMNTDLNYKKVLEKLQRFYERLPAEEQQAVNIIITSETSYMSEKLMYDKEFRVRETSRTGGYAAIEGVYTNQEAFKTHLQLVYPTTYDLFSIHGRDIRFGKGVARTIGKITYL